MTEYPIGSGLIFPFRASERDQELSGRLELQRGYRVIGGNRGDLRFTGYTVDPEGGTELTGAVLVSSLDLTPDEAYEIALEVVEESFASIGTECVEHS